ncbi:KGG domain-containing protein [Massilia sp. S19_KUP03_FR1]|uniref:KGG domain-containing protein n=1 Tax=Massilia sp. S19_KUP03_FR1 TaxID=3025503 RepID=UPI003FA553E1
MAGNDKQAPKQGTNQDKNQDLNKGNQGSNQDPRQGSNQGSNQSANQPGNQSGNQRGSQGDKPAASSQSDTSARGFASMDPDKQREIAAEGGRAAHAAGTAHEFTSQEARAAGKMSHKNDGNEQSGMGQGNMSGQPSKK